MESPEASPTSVTEAAPDSAPAAFRFERRARRRFAIALELHYSGESRKSGEGALSNISSSGLLLHARDTFMVGSQLDISIAWPYLLNGCCPLQLRIRGKVVRSDGFGTAVAIEKHEFRTVAKLVA